MSSTADESRYDKDNSSVSSFFVAFGINSAIFLALIFVFLLVRPWKITPRLINLRRYFSARIKGVKHVNNKLPYIKVPVYEDMDVKKLGNRRFPWGALSWIPPVLWSYSDRRLFRTHGADALMYMVFVRNCFILCVCLALPALVILLPINTQGGNDELEENDEDYVTGMGIITIGNVSKNSGKLAAHIVFTYIFSILAYIFVIVTYKQFMWIRRKWMNQNCARAYTIMVEELPHRLRNDEALYNFFSENFPGKVMAAHIAYNTKTVRDMMDKRKSYIKKYEAACDKKNKKTLAGIPWKGPGGKPGPENPTTTTGFHGKGIGIPHLGEQVDAKEFFKRKVQKYERMIADVQADPAGNLKATHVGFVTFSTPFFARAKLWTEVGTLIKRQKEDWLTATMTVKPAPEPTDVHWENLTVWRYSFMLRSIIVTALMIVIIFLWFWPTLFIASLANLETISEIDGLGWLDFVSDLPPFVRGLIQGFLPPFLMFILNIIIYPLIKFAHYKIQGEHVKSKSMWLVMRVYWAYLIINVLLIITIGGAVFQVLQQVIDDPISIFSMLARTLPQQSLFFMLFLMVNGVSREPLSLYRIGNAIKWTIFLILAKNSKQRNWAQIPGSVDFAKNMAVMLLSFAIVMVYSVLSPLVPAFGVMYFGVVYLTNRHNIIYTHIGQFESGGNMWRAGYHCCMAAILLFQGTIIGIFAVGQSRSTPALAPPFVITILLWLIMHWYWSESSHYGSVSDCGKDKFEYRAEFSNDYIDPALRTDYICAYRFTDDGVPQPEVPLGKKGSDVEMQEIGFEDDVSSSDESSDSDYDESGKRRHDGKPDYICAQPV